MTARTDRISNIIRDIGLIDASLMRVAQGLNITEEELGPLTQEFQFSTIAELREYRERLAAELFYLRGFPEEE